MHWYTSSCTTSKVPSLHLTCFNASCSGQTCLSVLRLIGLEVLNLWATTPRQQQRSASGDQWNIIHRTGNQLGSRERERLEDVLSAYQTETQEDLFRKRVRTKVLKKVSISWNFSHIFRVPVVLECLCVCVCVCVCVCMSVCKREISWSWKNILHHPSQLAQNRASFFVF